MERFWENEEQVSAEGCVCRGLGKKRKKRAQKAMFRGVQENEEKKSLEGHFWRGPLADEAENKSL